MFLIRAAFSVSKCLLLSCLFLWVPSVSPFSLSLPCFFPGFFSLFVTPAADCNLVIFPCTLKAVLSHLTEGETALGSFPSPLLKLSHAVDLPFIELWSS